MIAELHGDPQLGSTMSIDVPETSFCPRATGGSRTRGTAPSTRCGMHAGGVGGVQWGGSRTWHHPVDQENWNPDAEGGGGPVRAQR